MSAWKKAASAEGALIIGGLLLWLMSWAIDLSTHIQEVAQDPTSHSHGGGETLVRVNFPLTGFPLVVFGMLQMVTFEKLQQRKVFIAFIAGIFFLLDGLAHAFAFNDHLNQPLSAALFAIVAPLQILVGVTLPFMPQAWDRYWAALALAMIALYAASRTVALPGIGFVEPVDGLGVFSKFFEVVILLLLLARWRSPAEIASEKATTSST